MNTHQTELAQSKVYLNGVHRRTVILPILVTCLLFHCIRTYQVTSQQPTDFRIFYESSRDALAGRNPYRVTPSHLPYIYPPLLIWMVTPLTEYSLHLASQIWTILSFVAWIVLVVGSLRIMGIPARSATTVLLAVPSILAYRFILRQTLHGQVDMMVWAVTIFAINCMLDRRERLSGSLFAIAIVTKPIPIFFILFLLIKRQWRTIAWFILISTVLLIIPSVTYGTTRNIEILDQWVHGRIGQDLTDISFEVTSANQSIQAMLYRYFGRRDFDIREQWPAPATILENKWVNGLYLVFCTSILSSVLVISRELGPFRERAALELALMVAITHLVSRRTTEYHLVSQVFTYTVAIACIQSDSLSRCWRLAFALTTAGMGFLQNFYSPLFVGMVTSTRWQSYSPSGLSQLLFWSVVTFALSRWQKNGSVRCQEQKCHVNDDPH